MTFSHPAPLSHEERLRHIRQYLMFRQNAETTRDTATCRIPLLYSTSRREHEADGWDLKADAQAAVLELDDRITGRDFLAELSVQERAA